MSRRWILLAVVTASCVAAYIAMRAGGRSEFVLATLPERRTTMAPSERSTEPNVIAGADDDARRIDAEEGGRRGGAFLVLVEDATGRPVVNATVVLAAFGEPSSEGPGIEGFTRRKKDRPAPVIRKSTGKTDHTGRASLERLDGEPGVTGLAVRAVGSDLPFNVRELELPTPDSITLTLPAYGSLEVELVDVAGRRHLGVSQVRVFQTEHHTELLINFENGLAVCDHIPIAAALEVLVKQESQPWSPPIRTRGPSLQGETVRVRAVVLAEPQVTGRAIDEEGRPLAGRLDLDFRRPGMPARWTTVAKHEAELEADGSFAVSLPAAETPRELLLGASRGRGAPLEARVVLPPLTLGARHHLGDIILEPVAIAVAGRVVGHDGQPVPGAYVDVFERRPPGRILPIVEGVRIHGDGAFRIRARVDDSSTLVVRARGHGLVARTESGIRPGRSDLELRIERK